MERLAWIASAVFGFLAVALGAFGAHGLKAKMLPLADGAQRLEWWATGAHYQAIHALALGLVAVLAARAQGPAPKVAVVAFSIGIVLFFRQAQEIAQPGESAFARLTGGAWARLAVAMRRSS